MKKNLQLTKKVIAYSAIATLLASCGSTDVKITDEDTNEVENNENNNVGVTNTSPYDNSLADFGKMLAGYNIPVTRVMNKDIGNASGDKSLPKSLSRMLSTAMGKIENKIKYIEYDARFIAMEKQIGTNINRTLPDILIVGDITEADKGLISKDMSLEGEGEYEYKGQDASGGAEGSSEAKASRLAMDFNILDYRSGESLGCNISNKVIIQKTKSGYGFSLFFSGFGGSINSNVTIKQGKEAALRRLLDLSAIQTLGKHFQVPYWKVIPGTREDAKMIEKMREQFVTQSDIMQRAYIKEYLFLHCVGGIDRTQTNYNSNEMQMVSSKKTQYGVSSDVDLFIALWENVPVEQSRIRFLKLANLQNTEADNARFNSQPVQQQPAQVAEPVQQQPAQVAAPVQQQPAQVAEPTTAKKRLKNKVRNMPTFFK